MRSRASRPGIALALGAAGLLMAGAGAAAQTRAEARSGFAVGNHTSTAAGFEWVPEVTYEIRIARQLRPRLAVTAGYVRTAFGCEEGFCRGHEPTVTGRYAVLGGEVSWKAMWGRAGVLYGTTRVGTRGEAPEAGPGLEVGAGLRARFGRVLIGPGISLRRMSADTPSSSDRAVALSFDLGVGFEFD